MREAKLQLTNGTAPALLRFTDRLRFRMYRSLPLLHGTNTIAHLCREVLLLKRVRGTFTFTGKTASHTFTKLFLGMLFHWLACKRLPLKLAWRAQCSRHCNSQQRTANKSCFVNVGFRQYLWSANSFFWFLSVIIRRPIRCLMWMFTKDRFVSSLWKFQPLWAFSIVMWCFPENGCPVHHRYTSFFAFSQCFCFTFGHCKEDTSTVHISAAKTEFCHALYKERATGRELYKKKRVRPNEFQATNLPTRTFFHYINNHISSKQQK